MRPANDPNVNYRKLVEQGFDQCTATYEAARLGTTQPELQLLTPHLTPGAVVLGLGCGAGVPIAKTLAENYPVTGIDLSAEQIRRARVNVPRAAFIQAEMIYADFPDVAVTSDLYLGRRTNQAKTNCAQLPAPTLKHPLTFLDEAALSESM
jgi:cyclopropane fatty-acyl-phospholipid synthase-like methyltransferase